MALQPPTVPSALIPSGPAALLLSAAQLALLDGYYNDNLSHAIVGSLNNGVTPQPSSLNPGSSPSGTAPANPTGSEGQKYNLTFDVISEEQHTDELLITDHPVEQGSVISDNAVKQPALVVLQVGFTMSGTNRSAIKKTAGAMQRFYAFFLKIQVDRTPFTVYTSKRVYPNMLLKSIATRTDVANSFSLPLTLVCREIIIAQTSSVSVSGDQAVQAAPQDTTPTVQGGSKQLTSGKLFVPLDSPDAVGGPSP